MIRPLVLIPLVALTSIGDAAEVSVEPSNHGRRVRVDGELFAEYRTDSGGRPVLWPVIGPTGEAMTRSYPVGPIKRDETPDHPHHRGVWIGHDRVGGVDFWHDPGAERHRPPRGRQVHRRFLGSHCLGNTATIVAETDWVGPDGRVIATDERTLRFGAEDDHRWIDFQIALKAAGDEPLVLGDSKEGVFAIRVPGAMKLTGRRGGQIVNSEGDRGAACWGLPAEWVDYHGPASPDAGSETVGVALMSHPSNQRPKPRWHVRPYGLFAANPIGERPFPPVEAVEQGPLTIAAGGALRLRYRVVLHRGDEVEGRIAERFRRFCEE